MLDDGRHFIRRQGLFSLSLASRLAQRAWYRKDGTPRSKIRGAVYTLIGSCIVLVSISALEVMEDLQDLIYQLVAMLQVQRVVYEDYNLVDFSDYRQTAEYFRSLSTPFLLTAQEADEDTVDHFFDHLVNLDDETSGQLKERVHVRMKEAATEVHHLVQGIKDQPLESFQSVVKVMREALYEVITDVAVEADERVAALVKAFKDDPGKPPPPKGRGYELIG
ncbi:hypothetical protein AAF712_003514 [Marasmius tenuissimus]|uniref:Uncharacterized protein n=1 Tax=Marasmius tenuissimus TaxID=585030 RepID=A0ABR3A824_9AGAR